MGKSIKTVLCHVNRQAKLLGNERRTTQVRLLKRQRFPFFLLLFAGAELKASS